MSKRQHNPKRFVRPLVIAVIGLSIVLSCTAVAAKDKKKKEPAVKQAPKTLIDDLDLSKIVWPNPPAITRIRYMRYFSAEKQITKENKPKSNWMDRLAGVTTGEDITEKPRFHVITPYGVAVNSKGKLYVGDSKVRAVFVFDTETGDLDLIKNGTHARFGWITGLAIDDADNVFVADSKHGRVLVFDPSHKQIGSISEGLISPGGMAIDNENRFLYVPDAERDQVMVYDADPPYKLLRTIGKRSKNHELTGPGEFSRPSNCAVDADGNLYVSDTWNNRIEVFDADGNFIREFGKAGDGPGYFARPKGVAIDSDGHVWVADSVQNRVQVFTPEGNLLIWMGGTGILPGQFRTVVGLAIDKSNRVFTTEQFPGRVQMFRYTTNTEALAEKERRDALDAGRKAEASPTQ
ncbi:MAG TPA: SMP-30/gluconolactonase/LRE family protein [Terriglobales bacterium]|nr:SMP-30/gluconolactonase/LRE family protein [Terriglobales bacterium]